MNENLRILQFLVEYSFITDQYLKTVTDICLTKAIEQIKILDGCENACVEDFRSAILKNYR